MMEDGEDWMRAGGVGSDLNQIGIVSGRGDHEI